MKTNGSQFFNDKPLNFSDKARGEEVERKIKDFIDRFINDFGIYPPRIPVTVQEMKEFLIYIRNWKKEQVRDLPDGFPEEGQRGYYFGAARKGLPPTSIEFLIINQKFF
jgi:hypothetical protein